MTTYRIYTTEGKSHRFQGELIASVESDRISTSRGKVWFELNAYERDNHQWVTTIAMKHEHEHLDEVLVFYSSFIRLACEDFLYDFDPLRILPNDHVVGSLPENRSLMAAADHSYYAAVRRLAREMESHDAKRLASLYAPQAPRTAADPGKENGMVSRIKDWLHI